MARARDWKLLLQEAEECCRCALREPELAALAAKVGDLREPSACFAALSRGSATELEVRRPDPEEGAFERWLLCNAGLAALPQIPRLRVADSVKALFAEEFRSFARPPDSWRPWFRLGNVRYSEMARVATLRRFPAGQFQWEVSGLAIGQMLHTPLRQWPGLAAFLLRARGARKPLVETHVNDRRRNRLTLLETEAHLSYYRIARSVELQPEIRGLLTCSWLYCRTTAEVTPRLAWLRGFFEENGAFLGTLGPAPVDSGFLVGSEERKRLYDAGEYRPQLTYVIWPRKAMLQWAAAHPQAEPRP